MGKSIYVWYNCCVIKTTIFSFLKESDQMEQAIVITDVLDYYEKYKSLDMCDSSCNYEETWKILVDDHDIETYALAINASLEYHPRDGSLILLSLKGKVFCMGVYNAYTSMEQNKIIFYPGTFFILEPIDYNKKIDPYIDRNLTVKTDYETLYYINAFDVDGGTTVAEIVKKAMYNSVWYEKHIEIIQEMVFGYDWNISLPPYEEENGIRVDDLEKAILSYDNYNYWNIWDYNIMASIWMYIFGFGCTLCGEGIPVTADEHVLLNVFIIEGRDREDKSVGSSLYNILSRHAILCPYCYQKVIRKHCTQSELSHIRESTLDYITENMQYRQEANIDDENETIIDKQLIEETEICDNQELQSNQARPITEEVSRVFLDKSDISDWSLESVLMEEGYTVRKDAGLTAPTRWRILKKAIDGGRITARQAIAHIEFQIKLRQNNKMFAEAIRKWQLDLEYLRKNY